VIMTVSRQVCPFHADEDIQGVPTGSGEGSLSFTCPRTKDGAPVAADLGGRWLNPPLGADCPDLGILRCVADR